MPDHDQRREPGTDATPLKVPHCKPVEPADREIIDVAQLLAQCARIWRTTRHPLGEAEFEAVRPLLAEARCELVLKSPTAHTRFLIYEIDKYLPKACR